MSRQLLFVHSAGPQGQHQGSNDLVTHLRAGLGSTFEVRALILPRLDDPHHEPWRSAIEKELAALDPEALLVGHSLGASVLLKVLSERAERRPWPGIFLLATPFWEKKGWDFTLASDFAARLPRIDRLVLFHSRDDQEIPIAHLDRYAHELPDAIIRPLDGYGHLFDRPCPELVGEIQGRGV